MFPFCNRSDKLTHDYSGARVVSAAINESKRSMSLAITLAEPAPPLEINLIENMIAREYELASVSIATSYVRPPSPAKSKSARTPARPKTGFVILGKQIKGVPIPVESVKLELGKATVRGEVCSVSHKKLEKSGAWILSFDLTDYTGTINVSKYLKDENASKIVNSIQKGMWLTVSGSLELSKKYDGDTAIEPRNIVVDEKEQKLDTAPEKRVELHLHTKMSALDAVTDVKEAIKRAAEWGHPAIAITDHGVVQAFPEAAQAASELKGKVKVIYGVEGYYINDVENCTAVFSTSGVKIASDSKNAPDTRDGEFVVFDIETTGLSPVRNSIFEIGAVLVKDGKICEEYHTFVDPGVPIPYAITDLTGVKDSDLEGAASQKEALASFLDFAGNRTLVAHNATLTSVSS